MIAEKNIQFQFLERLEIFSSLLLYVPKEIQQSIKEHVILSVVIPSYSRLGSEYVGNGVIKKV